MNYKCFTKLFPNSLRSLKNLCVEAFYRIIGKKALQIFSPMTSSPNSCGISVSGLLASSSQTTRTDGCLPIPEQLTQLIHHFSSTTFSGDLSKFIKIYDVVYECGVRDRLVYVFILEILTSTLLHKLFLDNKTHMCCAS